MILSVNEVIKAQKPIFSEGNVFFATDCNLSGYLPVSHLPLSHLPFSHLVITNFDCLSIIFIDSDS